MVNFGLVTFGCLLFRKALVTLRCKINQFYIIVRPVPNKTYVSVCDKLQLYFREIFAVPDAPTWPCSQPPRRQPRWSGPSRRRPRTRGAGWPDRRRRTRPVWQPRSPTTWRFSLLINSTYYNLDFHFALVRSRWTSFLRKFFCFCCAFVVVPTAEWN